MKNRLEMTIGRHTLPVVVQHDGVFWAEWEGESYRSESFKGLRTKLLPKVRDDAKRCELPALLRDYADDWQEIWLIGIHADNGNVLYRDATGKTHQLGRRDRRVYRLIPPAEMAGHDALVAQVQAAQTALNRWLKTRVLLPGAAVRKAIGLPVETDRDDPLDPDEDLT